MCRRHSARTTCQQQRQGDGEKGFHRLRITAVPVTAVPVNRQLGLSGNDEFITGVRKAVPLPSATLIEVPAVTDTLYVSVVLLVTPEAKTVKVFVAASNELLLATNNKV